MGQTTRGFLLCATTAHQRKAISWQEEAASLLRRGPNSFTRHIYRQSDAARAETGWVATNLANQPALRQAFLSEVRFPALALIIKSEFIWRLRRRNTSLRNSDIILQTRYAPHNQEY